MNSILHPPSSAATPHPVKRLVTRREFTALCAANTHLILRKYDGEFTEREHAGAIFLCERVCSRSGAFLTAADRALIARHGTFYAVWGIVSVHGQNVLARPMRERWGIMCSYAGTFPPNMILAETINHQLNELSTVMASGAEGVCAVPWDAAYGSMLCHKVATIYLCRVRRAAGATQSVEIERLCEDGEWKMEDGRNASGLSSILDHPSSAAVWQPCGKVALRGGKCDQVRPGSLIRVEGMGLTDAGKIRQPQPCREWLVQY